MLTARADCWNQQSKAVPILTAPNALESAIRTATMHAEQSSQLIDEQAKIFGALIITL
ncbi:hypothetical protein WAI453_011787 [Rhynchosporium graminicola]